MKNEDKAGEDLLPSLSMYRRETHTCAQVLKSALFVMAKRWKQTLC